MTSRVQSVATSRASRMLRDALSRRQREFDEAHRRTRDSLALAGQSERMHTKLLHRRTKPVSQQALERPPQPTTAFGCFVAATAPTLMARMPLALRAEDAVSRWLLLRSRDRRDFVSDAAKNVRRKQHHRQQRKKLREAKAAAAEAAAR